MNIAIFPIFVLSIVQLSSELSARSYYLSIQNNGNGTVTVPLSRNVSIGGGDGNEMGQDGSVTIEPRKEKQLRIEYDPITDADFSLEIKINEASPSKKAIHLKMEQPHGFLQLLADDDCISLLTPGRDEFLLLIAASKEDTTQMEKALISSGSDQEDTYDKIDKDGFHPLYKLYPEELDPAPSR
jgi:hypothetical protein